MSAQPLTSNNPMAAVLAARAAQQQRSRVATITVAPAANIAQMPSLQPPVTALTSPTSAVADLAAKCIKAAESHRSSMVELAYYGRLLREADSWQEAGFRDEDHFRQHLGYAESTWKQYMDLGERLSMLSLDQMLQLTQAAAKLLTRIHPRIWEEFSWVEEAKLLPARDFQALIESRNAQVAPTALAEPKSNVLVAVPMSQRKSIETRLERIRRSNRLGSSAAALSCALDAAESQSAITESLTAMQAEMSELANLWKPDAPWSTHLSESDMERNGRLDGSTAPASLVEAAARSQYLTRRILKSLEALNAVLPEKA